MRPDGGRVLEQRRQRGRRGAVVVRHAERVHHGELGTAHPASGSPVVFGLLNLQAGPVTFPEVAEAEQAAAAYANQYLNGIGGHPIKIVTCATDGQPATSARCANQLLNQHPVAILGGADTGAPVRHSEKA